MTLLYVFIFVASCILLCFSGERVVESLMRIARILGLKEFVVAFFVMAFAASLPNLFIGVTSALRQIPQLSFGDVAGNNIVALTIAVALAVLIGKKELPAESRTVQTTSIFTIIAAILPLILILDGKLSRIDGFLLIALFLFYCSWLFSKRERFTKIYDSYKITVSKKISIFFKDLIKIISGIIILIISALGIVASAEFFYGKFQLPYVFFGVLIVGFGTALPEVYFAIASARRGESWMILGDLMGAVIVPATLVLGIVALIHPIEIYDFSSLAIARIFLIIAALFFFFFVRSDRKITKKEALLLLGIYLLFLLFQIITKLKS